MSVLAGSRGQFVFLITLTLARLQQRRAKVSIGWLIEQFGLQTLRGMRYGLHVINRRLKNNKRLRRTCRALDAL
jgi:hypothetical protein